MEGVRIGIVATTGGGSRRYRCFHRAEMLADAGADVDVLLYRDVDLEAAVRDFDCFILHRAQASAKVVRFFHAARRASVPVIYDTDDLVFDPALAESVPWKPDLPLEQRLEKFATRRRAMAQCNAVTVSTEPLRVAALEVNARVTVSPNVVSASMVEHGDAARAPRERSGPPVLGYFSGTASHDIDFLEAASAVAAALDAFPELRFLVVGPLRLPTNFERFSDRIDRIERRPFDELPQLIALADVAIAPLEIHNPFAEAKSAIKYLEAGLVGVPVVASATPDFVRVVRDGETGALARTPLEWRERLHELVAQPDRRHELGAAAWADVRAHHTTRARSEGEGREFAQLLAGTRSRSRSTRTTEALRRYLPGR